MHKHKHKDTLREHPHSAESIAASNARHTQTHSGLSRIADHKHNEPSAEQRANMAHHGKKYPLTD